MSSRSLGQCLICDDAAVGINFAVPTCAACKAFFRRNAVKLGRRDYVCQQDGDCVVTFRSRRFCNCCRLAKCFRVGMQKTLIRSEAEREARKQLVAQNRQKRVRPPLIKALDLIRPSNLLVLSNSESRYASAADQTLLTNIFSAYEQTCIVTKTAQYSSFPTSKQSSFHKFLNQYTERQTGLVKYFKLVPEFERLSIFDKIRLIRNSFCLTFPINEATLSISNVSQQLLDSVSVLFDVNVSAQLIRCIQVVHSYTRDRSLLKILLIINNLSTGIYRYRHDAAMDSIYDDTLAIFAAQSVYVELLWRYLLTRFPSEADVVKFYNKLIQDFIFVQTISFAADSQINNSAYEIERMDPLIQSMWPAPNKSNNSKIDDDDEMELFSPGSDR